MASSIRILSSTDVENILSQLDIVQLIDVHTATLFRTLALANAINLNPDGSKITDPERFVHSPHRLAVRAGSTSTSASAGGGGGCRSESKGGGGGLYTTLVMPSSVANYGTTVKLVSLPNLAPTPAPAVAPMHTSRGLPATTVVVDERTGAVKAVVNSRALNIRTALGEFSFLFFFSKISTFFGGGLFILYWTRPLFVPCSGFPLKWALAAGLLVANMAVC